MVFCLTSSVPCLLGEEGGKTIMDRFVAIRVNRVPDVVNDPSFLYKQM